MNAVVEMKKGALAVAENQGRMAVADIISHVAMVQEVMRAVMIGPSKENPNGVHYGIIPGTDKPTLLKSGAEVLCMAFRIADSYAVEDLSTDGVVRYRVTCTGTHQVTGLVLGTGMGEASSGEEKYKWRKASSRQEFEDTPPNMRRTKHGYNKFEKKAFEIQQVRTEPADLANTILKMANKRAKMAMVLNVTAASDCFSQDLDDMDEALRDHLTRRGEESQPEGQPSAEAEGGKPALAPYPEDKFKENLAKWLDVIAQGRKTADQIIGHIKTMNTLTAEQEKQIRAGKQAAAPASDAPAVSAAEVLEKLNASATSEDLDAAAGLIAAVPEAERAALNARYDELHAKFNPQE